MRSRVDRQQHSFDDPNFFRDCERTRRDENIKRCERVGRLATAFDFPYPCLNIRSNTARDLSTSFRQFLEIAERRLFPTPLRDPPWEFPTRRRCPHATQSIDKLHERSISSGDLLDRSDRLGKNGGRGRVGSAARCRGDRARRVHAVSRDGHRHGQAHC